MSVKPRMDTDGHGFEGMLHGELTHSIIGSAFSVLNEIGPGYHEKPYENALVVELRLNGHTLDQQRRFELQYKNTNVGEFVPDLIVDDAVIVDTKVIERITDLERAQMLNYLRLTKLRVGLIINFRKPKLDWDRVIL